MLSPDSAALADLKAALQELHPTGAAGFEGLLAVVLTRLTGSTFRLASSGTQDGEDGSNGDAVAFEGKLYTGLIPRSEVLSKIASLIGRELPPELWILGATVGASSQVVRQIESAAEKSGIATLILDWAPAAVVPPLAVLCAAAPEATAQFLADHLEDAGLAAKAAWALSNLAASPALEPETERLLTVLRDASLGLPQARAANRQWLETVFADRRLASQMLGQPLAPRADGHHPVLDRGDLVQTVASALADAPDGRIVAIVGGEGAGKSWLLAQGWLAAPRLMLLISAQELDPGQHGRDLESQIIAKFIAQTGDSATVGVRRRWEERLGRWAKTPAPSPRFVVCVDGLNQKADAGWPRWLDIAAGAVRRLGGVLVVTVRRVYFEDQLRTALASPVARIDVPEWSDPEVQAILQALNLEGEQATPEVRNRLRNPRLLGIALDLLAKGRIKTLVELSVERLLFEQIRTGAKDGGERTNPAEFTRTLSDHAREILSRVQSQQHFDRLVFDSRATGASHTLSTELLAVAGEHFFHPLDDDPTRYRLTDDGLVLALGLALIDGLKGAERNQLDVDEALATTLDPIAALDRTAEAVFAGAQVASLDDRTSPAIRAALVAAFLQMQNVDGRAFAPFREMLPAILPSALSTLERLAVSDRYVPNLDWLIGALRELRIDPNHWATMQPYLSRWLRTYSRRSDLDIIGHGLDAPTLEEKQAKSAERQERLWNALTPAERWTFEGDLHRRDEVDPGELHHIAVDLLAGMPLAPIADDLVASALSEALNSSPKSPFSRLVTLLRFNLSDGGAARTALLRASADLAVDGASTTARWARVAILRGLSTGEDGAEALRLVEVLTADRESRPGWRRIEDYCATDPCDPASAEPGNVAITGEKFEALDMSTLRRGRWVNQEDHFFQEAMTGIARFRPEIGVQTLRRYAQAAPAREGDLQMFLVTDLAPHAAALGPSEVKGLLEVSTNLSRPPLREDRVSGETWMTSQYALLAAFPHLDGDAQLQALLAPADPGSLMLDVIPMLKPPVAAAIDAAMSALETDLSQNRKLSILATARAMKSDLPAASRAVAVRLAQNTNSYVRSEAMAVLLSVDDPTAIKTVVDAGWAAHRLDATQNAFEIWRGSGLMVRAMEMGLLPVGDALDRMSPMHFSAAAATGVPEVAEALAERLRLALSRALDIDLPPRPPYAELRGDESDGDYPPLFSLVDADIPGATEALERLSEDPDAFHERQIEGRNAFNAFDANLTAAGARLIVDNPGFGALDACVTGVKGWGQEVADDLLALPAARRPLARNFALALARSLSATAPETATALVSQFEASRAYTGVVYGAAQVPLAAFCVWGGAENAVWDAMRTARLDGAEDDAALAAEVLAALSAGGSAFLEAYAEKRLASDAPARQARGLMVLGLGAPSAFAEAQLATFGSQSGFLGHAAEAAQYAYERNLWSRHWRSLMIAAETPEAYWAASVLFSRIVDGRYAYWGDLEVVPGSVAERFDPTVHRDTERRIKAWQGKRKKTLFGDDVPPSIFMEPPVTVE